MATAIEQHALTLLLGRPGQEMDICRILITWTSLTEACPPYSRLPKMNIPLASGETIYMIFGPGPPSFVFISKTSQELRMQSRSVSDCKSLTLNVMIQAFAICQQ